MWNKKIGDTCLRLLANYLKYLVELSISSFSGVVLIMSVEQHVTESIYSRNFLWFPLLVTTILQYLINHCGLFIFVRTSWMMNNSRLKYIRKTEKYTFWRKLCYHDVIENDYEDRTVTMKWITLIEYFSYSRDKSVANRQVRTAT